MTNQNQHKTYTFTGVRHLSTFGDLKQFVAQRMEIDKCLVRVVTMYPHLKYSYETEDDRIIKLPNECTIVIQIFDSCPPCLDPMGQCAYKLVCGHKFCHGCVANEEKDDISNIGVSSSHSHGNKVQTLCVNH